MRAEVYSGVNNRDGGAYPFKGNEISPLPSVGRDDKQNDAVILSIAAGKVERSPCRCDVFSLRIMNLIRKGEINIYTYCLFCETQKCKTIANIIEHNYGIRSISPEIIQRKWTKGVCEEKRHDWLPGYVFLYAEEPITESIRVSGIIRRLGDGELQDEDLAFANMLYEHDGVMGTIHLIEEGQYCSVNDPLWQKMEGKVIKIDRGRKRCCVEFTFDSVRRTVWLGYELIKPIIDDNVDT